ncbi:hypothetical protein [Scytonema sp. NUACC21]
MLLCFTDNDVVLKLASHSTNTRLDARPGVLCATDEEFEAELRRSNRSTDL